MLNEPIVIAEEGFQSAWIKVLQLLQEKGWEFNNLVVQIKNPTLLDMDLHHRVFEFSQKVEIQNPKQVAYTIFPQKLYENSENADQLYLKYNRKGGFYERVKTQWGTYFRRMTNYKGEKSVQNQLRNIILAINERKKVWHAAYTIIIQKPGSETIMPLGGPCLNYIALQLEKKRKLRIGLLAVYRNHEFLKRAYGNYWGLCNLLRFVAKETNAEIAPITCISSHAYVDSKKTELIELMREI
ncbi:MAG: hypothetical protein FVQ81_16270 [Candidatus Glassbacteria bacterium]|nr:hypothetical protein [Candidatus Glassbacteria bacterium]